MQFKKKKKKAYCKPVDTLTFIHHHLLLGVTQRDDTAKHLDSSSQIKKTKWALP